MTLQLLDHYGPMARLLWWGVLALGLPAWWALILWVPDAVWAFCPEQLGWAGVYAFALPDALCVWVPTLYLLLSRPTGSSLTPWLWWVAGAQSHSSLWCLAATLYTGQGWLGPVLMLPVMATCLTVAWTARPAETWFVVADPQRSPVINLLLSLLQASIFELTFLVAAPWILVSIESWLGLPTFGRSLFVPMVIALVLCNLAVGKGSMVAMAIWGQGTPLPIDTAAKLVVVGPYAFVRNPMAAIGIVQGILLGMGLGSPLVVLYSLAGGVVWHGFVRPIEEADLAARFGEPYQRYCQHVPLWLPRLRPYRP